MLGGSHVALEVQHDVARHGSEYFEAKGRKNVSHVVLGGSDVALGVQQDVARLGYSHILEACAGKCGQVSLYQAT